MITGDVMHAIRQTQFETPDKSAEPLGDIRFRKLMSHAEWHALPAAVRNRFSKRLAGGAMAVYSGIVREVRLSKLGHALATALRIMGAPLPIFTDVNTPTVVTVTEDVKTGGQIWTRLYGNRNGFPQVIHSAKRFSGPTGLEEYVGFGVNMCLTLQTVSEGLVFTSAVYRMKLGHLQFTLPKWMMPGTLAVKHLEINPMHFRFEMTLTHPLFGELVHQAAEYVDGAT
jgi:hypothetical protein